MRELRDEVRSKERVNMAEESIANDAGSNGRAAGDPCCRYVSRMAHEYSDLSSW